MPVWKGIKRQRNEYVADPSKGKPDGGANDLPRDHGIAIHFASSNVCRIKNVTVDDFENVSKKVSIFEAGEDKNGLVFVKVKHGPCFQLKNVDYVEEFNN